MHAAPIQHLTFGPVFNLIISVVIVIDHHRHNHEHVRVDLNTAAAGLETDEASKTRLHWTSKAPNPQSSPALPLIKFKLCRANSVHRAARLACLCFYAAPRARILWFYGCRRAPNGPIYAISCIMASSPHTVSWSFSQKFLALEMEKDSSHLISSIKNRSDLLLGGPYLLTISIVGAMKQNATSQYLRCGPELSTRSVFHSLPVLT